MKQFDTIEIDNTSFGIILELCDGPSLDIYLKQHGALSEKEAKAIIWQILVGVKYLNDQPRKIIHYVFTTVYLLGLKASEHIVP